MRTAGKRPKPCGPAGYGHGTAVLCPHSRTGRSRPHGLFHPLLCQQESTPPAGIFRNHCRQDPTDACAKKFFSAALPDALWRRFSPVFFPARTAHPHQLSPVFPGMPVPAPAAPAYRPAPCFPSSYKGMDLPAPHPGNRLPPHKKLLPMAGLPQPLLRSSSTQSHPHGIPTDDHAAHGNPTHPGRPPQPSIVRGKLRETHAPGAPAARTLPSH